jgi:predicted RNase H-like HicB family nuclease
VIVLRLRLKDVVTEVIEEKDGSFGIACSALGIYSAGKTLGEAKKRFEEALDLHLSVLREKALKEIEASP